MVNIKNWIDRHRSQSKSDPKPDPKIELAMDAVIAMRKLQPDVDLTVRQMVCIAEVMVHNPGMNTAEEVSEHALDKDKTTENGPHHDGVLDEVDIDRPHTILFSAINIANDLLKKQHLDGNIDTQLSDMDRARIQKLMRQFPRDRECAYNIGDFNRDQWEEKHRLSTEKASVQLR